MLVEAVEAAVTAAAVFGILTLVARGLRGGYGVTITRSLDLLKRSDEDVKRVGQFKLVCRGNRFVEIQSRNRLEGWQCERIREDVVVGYKRQRMRDCVGILRSWVHVRKEVEDGRTKKKKERGGGRERRWKQGRT